MGWGPYCIWTCWFVLYIGHKQIFDYIYIYIYMLVCVGNGPWSTWLMRCFVLSRKLWSTRVIYDLSWARSSGAHEWLMIFVERGAMEHMGDWWFVLSKELWSTWMINDLSWARSFGAYEYLYLFWAGSSGTHEKIRFGSVGHKPCNLPCWCWA